jgi:hypothetical protein
MQSVALKMHTDTVRLRTTTLTIRTIAQVEAYPEFTPQGPTANACPSLPLQLTNDTTVSAAQQTSTSYYSSYKLPSERCGRFFRNFLRTFFPAACSFQHSHIAVMFCMLQLCDSMDAMLPKSCYLAVNLTCWPLKRL